MCYTLSKTFTKYQIILTTLNEVWMRSKIKKYLSNPRKYIFLLIKLIQSRLSFVFVNSSHFIQSQMDIHDKSLNYHPSFVHQTGGFFLPNDQIKRVIFNLDPWDSVRRDMIILLLRSINERNIPGDMAEVGVYKGKTARLMHHYMPDRLMHLFDTFSGFDLKDIEREKLINDKFIAANCSYDLPIDKLFKNLNINNNNVKIYKGYFPQTLTQDLFSNSFAFVHLDVDLYEPTIAGLQFFYERISKGGYLLVHDYNSWVGARKAMDEFLSDKDEIVIPMPDMSGSALIVKL